MICASTIAETLPPVFLLSMISAEPSCHRTPSCFPRPDQVRLRNSSFLSAVYRVAPPFREKLRIACNDRLMSWTVSRWSEAVTNSSLVLITDVCRRFLTRQNTHRVWSSVELAIPLRLHQEAFCQGD